MISGALMFGFAGCTDDDPPVNEPAENNTEVQVFIPDGAHATVTAASVSEVSADGYPNASDLASPVFDIGPSGTTFQVPVRIAIPINADTPAGTVLELVRFDEASSAWEPLPGSMIVGKTLVATTDHFSNFAILGTAAAAACDNLWSGGPGTVAPLLVPGAVTIVGAMRTSETVWATGDQFMAVASEWTVDACTANVTGNFGPGLTGAGAWTDFTNRGGGGSISQSGTFSFTVDFPSGPELGLADPCQAALGSTVYNLSVHFTGDCGPLDAGVSGSVDGGANGSADGGVALCEYDPACGTTPAGMICVPAGEFPMGIDSLGNVAWPMRTVCMPTYYIDELEVTVAEYDACLTAGACTPAVEDGMNITPNCNSGVGARANHPINCVEWSQAAAYCEWAGKRLPTEAEWEKAARGADERTYPWGEAAGTCDHTVTWRDSMGVECTMMHSTMDGASKSPLGDSPFGLKDVAGNVREYCSDWYARYDAADTDNPQGPASGTGHVVRGTGWRTPMPAAVTGRSESSTTLDDFTDNDNVGFRCATSL